jgi:hypothetical protein
MDIPCFSLEAICPELTGIAVFWGLRHNLWLNLCPFRDFASFFLADVQAPRLAVF